MPDTDPIFDSKPWWASRGVWGGLITIITGLLTAYGVDFNVQPIAEFGGEIITGGIVTIGGLLSLVGRYFADRKVVLWPTDSDS